MSEPSQDGQGNARGWYAVAVLIVAYTFSYVDRTILTLMVKPIRATLQISDLQVSLLHGLAFAIFYTALGVPIATLADRGNRSRIIQVGIAVWSLMTALCGFARNFAQLFLARVGVGVGEAALSPAAYSMLSDYFSGNALTRALSVYTGAMYIGIGLALMIGGAVIGAVTPLQLPGVGLLEPWQVVFLWVGLPGLAVAALMLTVREPPRRDHGGRAAKPERFAAVLRHMREQGGAYRMLIAGYSLHGLMWNGAMAWIPSFFIRRFGWSQADTGMRFGALVLVLGTIGVVAGAFVSNLLRNRGHVDANPRVGLISSIVVVPFGVFAATSDSSSLALLLFGGFVFAGSMPYGAAATAFQDITPNGMRAQVTAVYFFFLNLCGIGLGPTAVAALTDKFFHNDAAVGSSIAVVTAVAASLAALLLWRALAPYRSAWSKVSGSAST